ncbi:PPR repeat, partial [Musa troglodytarum]
MENPFLGCHPTDPIPDPFLNQPKLFRFLRPPRKTTITPFLAQKSKQKQPLPTAAASLKLREHGGHLQQAITALEQGSPIRSRVYISLLQSCIDADSIEDGRRLHASLCAVQDCNPFVETKLVSMYAKCGSLEDARRVFAGMRERNLFTWSAMIGGYAREQRWGEVVDLFFGMMHEGVLPDTFLLPRILQACSNTGNLETGRLLHSLAVRIGLLDSSKEAHVSNSVLAMYAKCGELDSALRFFEKMDRRDRVSWNSIISGHCQCGGHEAALRLFARMRAEGIEPGVVTWNILISCYNQSSNPDLAMELMKQMESSGITPDVFTWTSMISGLAQNDRMNEALDLFQEMLLTGVEPNGMTVASAISACASLQALDNGKELHSYAIRIGCSHSILVGNSLIDMYAKCGRLEDAQRIFDEMAEKDVFTWNSMIGGYTRAGYCGKAYDLFSRMESSGVRRNVVTWNAMISGYIQNGDEDQAMELFHMMEIEGIRRNTATWNTLIAGSSQNGDPDQALRIFRQMRAFSVRPNSVTILSILPACTNLLSVLKVKEIHSCILHNDLQRDISIANALIDTYSKSGDIEYARVVFNGLSGRDLISWNSMIAGLVLHGRCHDARDLFNQMKQEGIRPNKAIFASVINACGLDGLVNEGKKVFSNMTEEYQLSPGLEHYTGMVNLLGRSGRLREASDLIDNMPIEPDAALWNALLTAARIYGNIRIANLAATHLFKLEPRNPETLRLLSHAQALYGKSNDASKVPRAKKEGSINESHGCCWMEVKPKVITFSTGSQVTMNSESKLAEINSRIMDTNEVIPDFDGTILEIEEDSEDIVGTHSEKLAVAFGLVNLPTFRAIRIVKSNIYLTKISTCHVKEVMDPSVDTKAPTSSPTSLPPSSEMLPRTWSIFHVGEEGGEAPKTGEAVGAAIGRLESSKGTCQRLEGLRILIQNSGRRSNVVINSSLRSCMPHHLTKASAPQIGFLKACFLCRKELSPHKDVYMYRGDQGFCSEECRQDQILLDERTEAEASARGTMKPPLRRPAAANKVQESDRRRRILMYKPLTLHSPAQVRAVDCLTIRWLGCSFRPSVAALLTASRFHGSLPHSTALFEVEVEKRYAALLRAAAQSGALPDGRAIHGRILRTISHPSVFLSNSLANMYSKCRVLPHALRVFDEMPNPDVVSWNTVVDGCFLSGLRFDALACFREMLRCGVAPDEFSFVGVLKSCDLGMGFSAHCVVVKYGLGDSAFVASGLAEFYAVYGLLSDVMKVFESLERKDIVLVNAVIGLLAKAGNFEEAFKVFCNHVLASHLLPVRATFVNVLSGIDGFEFWREAIQVHGLVVKFGFEGHGAVQSSLIRVYANCCCMDDAHDLLRYSNSQNVISWTSLICGYASQEQFRDALDVFCHVYHDGTMLDDVLLACVLSIAAASESQKLGIQFHTVVLKYGFGQNNCINHALMAMYTKCMSMPDALKVFQHIGEDHNLLSWTILISGYAKCGSSMEALNTFYQMNKEDIIADSVACIGALMGCTDLQAVDQGEQIHAFLIKSGSEMDVKVQTALLSLYSECRSLNEAIQLFEMMIVHDVVSWTALISAYASLGCIEKALLCLNQMLQDEIKPNHFTFVSALKAAAKLTYPVIGKSIHAAIIKCGLEEDTFIGSALIDMYCKCGSIGNAVSYFNGASKHDLVLWNALLAGHAQHGNVLELLRAYEEMVDRGLKPDDITFLSILSGCSHGGLIDKVVHFFGSMRDDYGIRPQMEHHACVVGAFGRAGLLKDAVSFIEGMGINPGSTVLRTLVSFCIMYRHVRLGLASIAKMVLLGQMDSSAFVLVSNLYAVEEKWHDRRKIRDAMEADVVNLKK